MQPGLVTEKIIQEVKKRGLFYPPDSLINSGGLRGLKYGVTSDYVLGLEVVLPNGEMIRTEEENWQKMSTAMI